MSMIDAILFDMDGVLMDSEPLHLRATQFALGERARYTERDNQSFFGATDPEMFRSSGSSSTSTRQLTSWCAASASTWCP